MRTGMIVMIEDDAGDAAGDTSPVMTQTRHGL